MKPPFSDFRRFSYGGRLSDLANVAVWKFDVVLPAEDGRSEQQITCYVKHATRGEAFQALFAKWPKAKILGTGFPLTGSAAERELGYVTASGTVTIVQ